MLSLSDVALPVVEPWTVLLCIGAPPTAWGGLLHYPNADSLSRLAAGHSVDFL